MKKIVLPLLLLSLTACEPSKTMAPAYKYGVSKGAGSLGVHIAQRGDTVWTVSQKYNLDLRGIIDSNHLSPPYALKPGSRIALPAPRTYTAGRNDSLYTVSRLFNTTQTELASLNRLSPPYKLSNGQLLRIPNSYDNSGTSITSLAQMAAPAPLDKVESAPLPAQIKTETASMPPQPAPVDNSMPSESKKTETASASTVTAPQDSIPASTGKFLRPVNGRILSGFGETADGQHNDGINIAAVKGDAVRAADNGRVAYIGNEIQGYGNMILVRHQDQYMTAYAHLGKILVKKGDVVRRGQTIGTVGSTGFVDKPQLHFEIRKGKKAIDPTGLI